MEAFNIIVNKENPNKEKYKFILLDKKEEQENYLGDIYTYVPIFLNTLWESPKTVAKLIINSDKNDLKKGIAPFIANNFYENILSSNYIEDQLLYVIGLVLKDEIDKLKTANNIEKFLENTPCSILLEQLKLKQDVQIYFKTVIYKIVQNLEEKHSSFIFKFNVKTIEEDFNKTKEEIEYEYRKTGKQRKVIARNFFKKTYDEFSSSKSGGDETDDKNIFNVKYIPSLTKEELEKIMEENKKKNMKDFFNYQMQQCMDEPNIFSNEIFLKNILQSKISKEIFASYQIDFLKVIGILNELIKTFLNYLYLLPYSVKCICKMILIMIKKKFPDLSLAEYNAFVSKFFFNKLFSPVFEKPGTWALINNFIISGVTRYNLGVISFLAQNIFSSKFFISGMGFEDYTPFNWFIIDHMPEIYQFFENVTQVKLPNFLEKFVNNELDSSYKYNYFAENPEEGIFHRSICFNSNDLFMILKNMKHSKDLIFSEESSKSNILKKTLEKLTNQACTEEIKKIQNNIEHETIKVIDTKKNRNIKEVKEIKGKTIIKFILLSDLITNKHYTKIFNLNEENCFKLQDKKSSKDIKDMSRTNIIKVKNYIYKLLNNYRTLVKADFVEGSVNNTTNILKELKKYMKVSNFVIDGSIPSQWYVDSLLEDFNKIPSDLKSDDYANLYKEINQGLITSMKDFDFQALSVVLSNVKFCKRSVKYYQKMKTSLIDLELNEKVQNIIDHSSFSVELDFKYTNKIKELKIEKSNKKDIRLESLENIDDIALSGEINKSVYCRTIKAFTKRFPNITKYQQILEKTDKNLMDIEKDFKLTYNLGNYFNFIKSNLQAKLDFSNDNTVSKEFNDVFDKIYDYVMEKLYDKLIPKEPDPIDNRVFNQCKILSWIEPKNFIKSKVNYVLDSFLPDVIEYFKEMEKEKSPRKKFICMSQIFNSIANMVKFSGGKDIGADDSQEILVFALIKAKPSYIYTNCKYMNLFIGDKKLKEEGLQLTQLIVSCEFTQKMNSYNLLEVDNDQFVKRCATFSE